MFLKQTGKDRHISHKGKEGISGYFSPEFLRIAQKLRKMVAVESLRSIGYDYIAKHLMNSLTLTSTSLVYWTTTSTVTITSVATCYNKSLFAQTERCRKKRELGQDQVTSASDEISNNPTSVYR